MKILFFAPHQFWPLTTGTRVRDYYFARGLSLHSEVTFLELLHPKDGHGPAPEQAGVARVVTARRGRTYSASRLLKGLIGPWPVTVWNCYSNQAARLLAKLLREESFDAVHLVGSPLAAYLPLVRNAPGRPAVVMDWHNIESVLMRRYSEQADSFVHRVAARRSAHLLGRLEGELLESCDAHVAVSEADQKLLASRSPSARVFCIPNGVDTGWFEAVLPEEDGTAELRRRRDLLFVGSMDYFANVDAVCWFHREAWPEIQRRYPELRLVIAGRDPHPRIAALRSERVQVTGTVEDVRPYYRDAVAAVVPLRAGAGSRLKIPEAMAAGVPVLSTRLGAEGLDLEPDQDYLIAETPAQFTAAVGRLMAAPELWQSLSEKGRRLARERFDWSILVRKLWEVHREVQRERTRREQRGGEFGAVERG